MKRTFTLLVLFITALTAYTQTKATYKTDEWIPIFNGKNLDGWIPKVTGYKAGENPLEGFRVENGILKIDYSKFAAFNGRFGHLFYHEKLSSYILRVEYRFVGEMLPDAPGYCYRNSGVMIHSESPWSMDIVENWPVSLETQLLGSTSKIKQTTANICTPGTTIAWKGVPTEEHCLNSTSKYYQDGEWVTLDIIVNGSASIFHIIDGDTVMAYSKPRIGGFLLSENYPVKARTLLEDGYIALQAEGQPVEFRKILLKKTAPARKDDKKHLQVVPLGTSSDVLIDNFEGYANHNALSKAWYHPGHGGEVIRSLDPVNKGGGKYGLRCDYSTKGDSIRFYSPFCRVDRWNLGKCNGVSFWFKPDGSGREFTITFNIADKKGSNIHDLWDYKYKTEKGDTCARYVIIPFFSLVKNARYADSPETSPVFLPDRLIEVSICIGSKTDPPGSGTFYFDEFKGTQLQF